MLARERASVRVCERVRACSRVGVHACVRAWSVRPVIINSLKKSSWYSIKHVHLKSK